MFVGVLSSSSQGEYVKIYQNLIYKRPTAPQTVKKIIVSGDTEIKRLYDVINGEFFYEILVDTGDDKILLEGERLYAVLSNYSPYESIINAIKKEG